MVKKKRIILIALLLSILFIVIIGNNSKALNRSKFKYNYELDKDMNVKAILNDKKIIIEEDNNLKIYNLDSKNFESDITEITENYIVNEVEVFDRGLVWIETYNENYNIYIKYFDSNTSNLLEKGSSKIPPVIDLNSECIVYYTADNEVLDIKYMNLNSKYKKNIASYKMSISDKSLISRPSTDGESIVWSYKSGNKSSLSKYNIKNDTIESLPNGDKVYNPIIIDGAVFAVMENTVSDEDNGSNFASDYIVELNPEENEWFKFKNDIINRYVDEPQETIFGLVNSQNLFYWISSFSDGGYIYNLNKDEFISIANKEDIYKCSILLVEGSTVYYQVITENDTKKYYIYTN